MTLALSSLAFREAPRAAVRAMLVESLHFKSAPAGAIDEVVDLACHAAETARSAMLRVLDSASDHRVELSAVGIAASLLEGDCAAIKASLVAFAAQAGLPVQQQKLENEIGCSHR